MKEIDTYIYKRERERGRETRAKRLTTGRVSFLHDAPWNRSKAFARKRRHVCCWNVDGVARSTSALSTATIVSGPAPNSAVVGSGQMCGRHVVASIAMIYFRRKMFELAARSANKAFYIFFIFWRDLRWGNFGVINILG